mmetsp:Transcript_20636/g.25401  ORF Transcript_20636/g.25401 Transcript_20636/m.25401 type:complete len:250 (+) Transcript_20636:596-1345(+)
MTNTCTSSIIREGVMEKEIVKGVLRKKLSKMRHLMIPKAIHTAYIEEIFANYILKLFDPQTVKYNGGVARIKQWKISCYLEVMDGGIPCTNPNIQLLHHCLPLLDSCNELFLHWYKQQHSCNGNSKFKKINNNIKQVKRIMTFITRYTPSPNESALLKHIDGAGKVDGSVVVALPIDRWTAAEDINSFEGHGGGLTFWDGKGENGQPKEIYYETRCGDVAFIDRAVWHQANPITKGTRWALVIFYKVIS